MWGRGYRGPHTGSGKQPIQLQQTHLSPPRGGEAFPAPLYGRRGKSTNLAQIKPQKPRRQGEVVLPYGRVGFDGVLDLRTLASETNKLRPPPLVPNENARLESAPSEWGKEGGGIGPMKTKTFYSCTDYC